jgi:hypothetical protein
MRQVVRAPFRTYIPFLIGGAAWLLITLKPWSPGDLTWQDVFLLLAVVGPFLAFLIFMLRLLTTMAITISDTVLTVREEIIPLEEIVSCIPLTESPEVRSGSLSYKIRTGNRVVLPVPGVDSLVQVTLENGRQVAFAADDPEAIIQMLRRLCMNLRK